MPSLKILLVEPPPASAVMKAVQGLACCEPLALEMVAAGIRDDHLVRLVDGRFGDEDLSDVLTRFRPDVVACGAVTANVASALDVLSAAKRVVPGVRTVIGGHHATLVPTDFTRDIVNHIVLGEGELTFPELIDALASGRDGLDIPGTATVQNGQICTAPSRPPADLDQIPFPRRSLTEAHRKRYFRGSWRPLASVMTSRGCPNRCRFCAMWRLNPSFRVRSPQKVASEIDGIDAPFIDFADDNTLADPVHALDLARALQSLRPRRSIKVYARADTVANDPALVCEWKKAGMDLALVGFEAFRDEDLASLGKGTTLAINEKAVAVLRDHDVAIAAYFLVRPDFGEDDFQALSDYVDRLELEQPVFTILTPFPGTAYYDEVAPRLTTNSRERFDLMHAVLPTRLPLERFAQAFAGLYRRAYGPEGTASSGFPWQAVERLASGQAGFPETTHSSVHTERSLP